MCRHGAAVIRLDAFAYAIKKKDTNCFFVEPEIWDLLHEIEGIVQEEQAEILPEIHEHYTIPMKIADKASGSTILRCRFSRCTLCSTTPACI